MPLELLVNNQKKIYKDILPEEIAEDQTFVEMAQKVAPFTMQLSGGAEGLYSLFHNVKYIAQNNVKGSIVECGVWRGGASMFMALALQHFGDTARKMYLYDTYAGMTEPEEIDIDFDGVSMRDLWQDARNKGGVIGYGGSVEDVKNNMLTTGYQEDKLYFIAGDVLETIPENIPDEIALLRLDTDWYKSTLHELEHLYPKLVPGGILIIDDYGWCKGARQATDEYFEKQKFKPLLQRVSTSIRVGVKMK